MAFRRLGVVAAGMMPGIALNVIEYNSVRAATAKDPKEAADARKAVRTARSFLMGVCATSNPVDRDAA